MTLAPSSRVHYHIAMLKSKWLDSAWFSGLLFALLPAIECGGGHARDMIASLLPDRTVAQGDTVTFICDVMKSNGTHWRHKDKPIDFTERPRWTVTSPNYPHKHTGMHTLTISNVQPEDAGRITCVADPVKPDQRNATVWALLRVVSYTINGKPVTSENVRVTAGDRVSLACSVRGRKPLPSLAWYRNRIEMRDIDCEPSIRFPEGCQLTKDNKTGRVTWRFKATENLFEDYLTCKAQDDTEGLGNTAGPVVTLPYFQLNIKARPRTKIAAKRKKTQQHPLINTPSSAAAQATVVPASPVAEDPDPVALTTTATTPFSQPSPATALATDKPASEFTADPDRPVSTATSTTAPSAVPVDSTLAGWWSPQRPVPQWKTIDAEGAVTLSPVQADAAIVPKVTGPRTALDDVKKSPTTAFSLHPGLAAGGYRDGVRGYCAALRVFCDHVCLGEKTP
ncbi:uncharacterized protein LOC129601343 isoform X2 [Paramacrobiotus metropolitanus]|uniref:uncharacterized protein LOC129601343 isoform X2 n=1 Tax=Paramacrobiotus metropolitanus TaxID=2943436 RepID=UPI002445EDF6|nr:uncharacterized protein LOC129601343 isoform X2 [Paramacrobiotus metropolitanus]